MAKDNRRQERDTDHILARTKVQKGRIAERRARQIIGHPLEWEEVRGKQTKVWHGIVLKCVFTGRFTEVGTHPLYDVTLNVDGEREPLEFTTHEVLLRP